MTTLHVTLSDITHVELMRLGRRCELTGAELLQAFAADLASIRPSDSTGRALAAQWAAYRCPSSGPVTPPLPGGPVH